MKPVFKEAVWGGKKLRDEFGYEIPGDSTGECWGIGAHKNGDCTIAEGTSIFKHDPKGKVAEAYKILTKEVLNNAEKRRKHQLEGVR